MIAQPRKIFFGVKDFRMGFFGEGRTVVMLAKGTRPRLVVRPEKAAMFGVERECNVPTGRVSRSVR